MGVLLVFGVALLCKSLVFADPHEGHYVQDKDDNHDSDDAHHKKGELYHLNKTLSCHKISHYISKFSFDLFRQVALDHPNENIVFSPVSISTAFAFLSLGAKAQTRSQILEGLSLNTSEISEEEIHEGFRNLLNLMNDVEREVQLSGGNGLFISKEYKILQAFLDDAMEFYHSEAFSTDFKNTEEAKNQINSYVEKNTHGKIVELLDRVDQNAILVLINYIYFKGKWKIPFSEKWTKDGDFHISENATVKVPFMTRKGVYDVAFTKEATVLVIPYKGEADALFILPKKGQLFNVEQNFYKEAINSWKKSFQKRWVRIYLPKFSVSGIINLKDTLGKLGIQDVFSNNADLSGITGEANTKISKAIHKAVLNVNEWGTEAAGATVIEITPYSLPPRVDFDRPFLFSLYDHRTKSILFTGRIANPQN